MSTATISKQGKVLITGASTGIGAIYADRIARRGYDLILVARNGARLNALAERITKETGRNVEVQVADLNNKVDLRKVEELLRTDSAITGLVNNAGVGAVTPLLESNVDKMEEMIDLNVRALTRLTYAAVPGFVARSKGTIVNIASVVGISPETLNGVYGATKSYVIGFTHSLQHELAEKGLRIQAVLPGATATEFWDVAGYPHSNLPKEIVMSAENLVDAALVGLERGEVIPIPPLQDGTEWDKWEAQRKAMATRLSNAKPGARYLKA